MPGVTSLNAVLPAPLSSPSPPFSNFEPHVWAPKLPSLTPPLITIPVPPSVLSALLSGTLLLPGRTPAPADDTWFDGTAVANSSSSSSSEPEDGGRERGREPESGAESETPALMQRVCASIDAAIAALGGVAVPKFGTVTPSDGVWLSFTRSLRCTTAGDVLGLVGASERALALSSGNAAPALTLRAVVRAAGAAGAEFRVFVCGGRVVGLSQRDVGLGAGLGEELMDTVVSAVVDGFPVVREGLVGVVEERFVYDVVVDGQDGWRVWVIDVGAWGEGEGILFEWTELETAEWMESGGRAQLRCVGSGGGIRPGKEMYGGLPLELRGEGAGEALTKAADRMTQLRRAGGEECGSGSDGGDYYITLH